LYDIENPQAYTVPEFCNQVKFDANWAKLAETHRNHFDDDKEAEKKWKKAYKKQLPLITTAGTFSKKEAKGLVGYSGFICLDIDDLEPAQIPAIRKLIQKDPYTYACFLSLSGTGLAVFVRIPLGKHAVAFACLEKYYLSELGIKIDPAGKDVTRGRTLTTDPQLYLNSQAEEYQPMAAPKTQRRKKEANPINYDMLVCSSKDILLFVDAIVKNGEAVDNDSYDAWFHCAMALAYELGEKGRDAFHKLSELGEGYDEGECSKQYDNALATHTGDITGGSLFWYGKQLGVDITQIINKDTALITQSALYAKQGNRSEGSVAELLHASYNIPLDDSKEIIEKVFARDIVMENVKPITRIKSLLSLNYPSLKMNQLTNKLESEGEPLHSDTEMNSIFIDLKEQDEKLKTPEIREVLQSNHIPGFHPIHDFIAEYKDLPFDPSFPNVTSLADCIVGGTGIDIESGTADETFVEDCIKKWGVGMIAGIYGKPNPLYLVLAGKKQNTGKTWFFEHLLPDDLKKRGLFCETMLTGTPDSNLLMTEKLLIMEDEMGGKEKKDIEFMKNLTSKLTFSVRRPYDRYSIDRPRLAALCGTTNNEEILEDPTGNRRILPIQVEAIKHDQYNSINKTALFMEFYHMYMSGYDWQMRGKDVERLSRHTMGNEVAVVERHLIQKYFQKPEDGSTGKAMNATEVLMFLEKHIDTKLNFRILARELNNTFKKAQIKRPGERRSLRYVLEPRPGSHY
jgi:predicted P-loop ATPase